MPPVPVLKPRLRNSRMSSMGLSTRSSHQQNTARTIAPMAKAVSVVLLPQPCCGAWMRPYTIEEMPMIESSAPRGSRLACSGSRERGTRMAPATRAMPMMGTLTRKIEPYQKWPIR